MISEERIAGEELQVLVQYQLIEALQEREHDLAEAQRLARLGSWVWDLATGVVTWSDELFRIFGVADTPFTPSFEGFLSLVHDDDRAEVESTIRAALDTHEPFIFEHRLKSHENCWLRGAGAVDLAIDGTVTRMHGTSLDISNEVANRAELAASERRCAELAAAMTDRSLTPHEPDPRVGEGGTQGQVRRDAERALRLAFERQQFVLHYQAKVSLEADRIVGAEALIRWQDPVRGMVPPLEFIPLAEEMGLIIPMGAWVILEACGQIAEWQRRFPRLPPLAVSVNVSGCQFRADLIREVSSALATTGAGANQLCLEVTESTLIGDADGAVETLQGLAALGVKLSIDDFGTGYSSLAYLKRLPLDELKIDKSFVDGLGEDSDDTAIVAATVAMAHALGLSVIAEGVETEDQLERLRVIGCQEVQGYFISRPQPTEAFTELLLTEENKGWRSAITVAIADDHAPAPYRPHRVLVVDDVSDVRQLARMALAASGFEVFEASSGSEALLMARDLRPDCVILDVSMPEMTGIEVCRALRDDERTAGCTVLMLTSTSDADHKIEAFSGGADDYVIKPFSPRDLVTRVRAALRLNQPDGGAHAPARPLPSTGRHSG